MKNHLRSWLMLGLILLVGTEASAKSRPHPSLADMNKPVVEDLAPGAPAYDGKVQVIAFNIERGFFRQDVVKYIEAKRAQVPATIVLLSECDRNHSRTHDVFVAEEMAKALQMNLVFVSEYNEFNDQTPETPGDHGNAVLSPFPLSDVTVIRHSMVFSWNRWGGLLGEPRFGGRVTIGATVILPDGKKVRVYSCHLESHADTFRRYAQMAEVFRDANRVNLPAVIGGDFNELPGGMIFAGAERNDFKNAFAGDHSPTGNCKPGEGKAKCSLKIDWILYRGLGLLDRGVDYPLNSSGGLISDHAPVRAVFQVK